MPNSSRINSSLPPIYRVLPWAYALAPLVFGAAIWYSRATRDPGSPVTNHTPFQGSLFSLLCLTAILIHAYRGPRMARSVLFPPQGKPHWFIRFMEFHQGYDPRADSELPTHAMNFILAVALAPIAFHFVFTMIGTATLQNHIILSIAYWLALWRLTVRVTTEIQNSKEQAV